MQYCSKGRHTTSLTNTFTFSTPSYGVVLKISIMSGMYHNPDKVTLPLSCTRSAYHTSVVRCKFPCSFCISTIVYISLSRCCCPWHYWLSTKWLSSWWYFLFFVLFYVDIHDIYVEWLEYLFCMYFRAMFVDSECEK